MSEWHYASDDRRREVWRSRDASAIRRLTRARRDLRAIGEDEAMRAARRLAQGCSARPWWVPQYGEGRGYLDRLEFTDDALPDVFANPL